MDWSSLGPLLAPLAPTIGGVLGGLIPFPGGSLVGEALGRGVAAALGVAPTPEAIKSAVATGNPDEIKAKLAAQESSIAAEVDKYKATLADIQNARTTTVEYVHSGSSLSLGAVIVSVIVMVGFVVISLLAMKPDLAGVDKSVTLYLLGAWQALATSAVSFWIGSSAGSADKSAQIANLSANAAGSAATAAAVKKK